MSNTFAKNSFGAGFYERFIKITTEQDAFMKSFEVTADKRFVDYYKNTINPEATNEVERMRNIAKERYVSGGFDIDPKYWFDTITNKTKSGGIINTKLVITPIKDESEDITHFIGIKQIN